MFLSLYLYYTYLYIYKSLYIHVHIHVYVNTYIYIYTHAHICLHVYRYISLKRVTRLQLRGLSGLSTYHMTTGGLWVVQYKTVYLHRAN